MAKKKTTEKALNIDNILFNCRDYLRAARNSGSFFEKRDMMLTLVFLRFIGEKYEDGIENLKQTLKEQGLDPEDENIRAAFFDDATFADGTYNLPPEARWSTIISTPAPQLNVALDTALQRLEEEDPQLKGCFVKGTFTARNLAANDIKKIVDEVNARFCIRSVFVSFFNLLGSCLNICIAAAFFNLIDILGALMGLICNLLRWKSRFLTLLFHLLHILTDQVFNLDLIHLFIDNNLLHTSYCSTCYPVNTKTYRECETEYC